MKCPFCQQPTPDNANPLEHMVKCSQEESQRMDQFFKDIYEKPIDRNRIVGKPHVAGSS
jgi:hypothetical protein